MDERAGRWLRVSTSGQDEENQEPSVDRWIADHDYALAETYRLKKSAYKGRHDAMLDRVIEDMHRGHITVLVVWKSSRIERRGAYNAFDLARRVREAGGRIEYVLDTYLNETNEMSDVMLALAATKDREESREKSERIRISFDRIDANGAIRNRAGYGYRIIGQKYGKRFEVIESEADVIRDVAERYLQGQSLAHICRWLNDNGRLTHDGNRWAPKTLAQVLRHETIMGRYRQGNATVKVPEIISVRDFNALQAKLDSRAYRKGVRTRKGTALLTSILRCGQCKRAMYRVVNTEGEHYYCRPKDGRSCKMLLPLAQMDAQAFDLLRSPSVRTITRDVVIPGRNYQNDIDQLALDIKALDPLDEGWLDKVTAIQAEIARLSALPAVPGRIETVEVDLSEYVATWPTMATGERRSVLIEHGIKIYATKDDDGSPVLSATLPKR
jgi:DNA invertase Pin-like site-specific DNA recombinase